MTNVIQLNASRRLNTANKGLPALIDSFAHHRRFGDDVFWLKENAEILNVLESTHTEVSLEALSAHANFYDGIEKRMQFFPQYYRFLLSICLDLEDLGMDEGKGEALCQWVAKEGLADAELSDLQRAEAQRLMLRRGVDPMSHDPALRARVHRFISRSETFALPNKKAAYELTHAVFYLSEYGRVDPQLSEAAMKSLEFAGILAFLDQNVDLLAEICVSLRFAGASPSPIWEGLISRTTRDFAIETGPHTSTQDHYHDYLMCNWLLALADKPVEPRSFASCRVSFFRPGAEASPLRGLSESLFNMADGRSADWHSMRPHVEASLGDDALLALSQAEQSTDQFEAFFAGFARAQRLGASQ
jgi:hypothetical protein